MALHEIVLPETKPETEWVRGRALQKVSPTYDHAALQLVFGMALRRWATDGAHGRVGSEWRFRVAPDGAIVRPLVPDVAFLSYADLPADAPSRAVQAPLGAPTVAVEILSPDDCQADVADKIETYLAAGTRAVLIVDPSREAATVHDGTTRVYRENETLTHPALPGFTINVGALFAEAKT